MNNEVIHQGRLFEVLKQLFKERHIETNCRKNSTLVLNNGNYLELDIFIPSINLAFEFQDSYHYESVWYSHESLKDVKRRDSTKQAQAHEKGITLVLVPCWWSGEKESLISSIHFERPDLKLKIEDNTEISLNPPDGLFNGSKIPDVGELMLASFPANTNFILSKENPWWVGEKYDGIRCCWNSTVRGYTRSGIEINFPPKIKNSFPYSMLDGEIWFGRGNYSRSISLLKGLPEFVYWDLLRIISFDNPLQDLQKTVFEIRYCFLLKVIPFDHPFAARLYYNKNIVLLKKIMKTIISDGGEGVILRRPASLYHPGRSKDLLKLKAFQGDREAVILSIEENGNLILGLPNGKTFEVEKKRVYIQKEREKEIKAGQIVSYVFEISARRQIPLSPSVVRVRHDLLWSDVVQNFSEEKKIEEENRDKNFTSKPIGYWTPSTMRAKLEQITKSLNLDPLLPETWYNTPRYLFFQHKEGKAIVRKLGANFFEAIQSLFPDLNLDKQKLSSMPRLYWSSIENRRNFFKTFAKRQSFNFKDPKQWATISKKKFLEIPDAARVLSYHNNSIEKALIDIFPDIGFDHEKFSIEKRKEFFTRYAEANEFDALISENWYSQPKGSILQFPGSEVLLYNNNNPAKALMEVYPNIGLIYSQLVSPRQYWEDMSNRKKFFDKFAEREGFDPLIPENWYSVERDKIVLVKNSGSVLRFYNGSVIQALLDVYNNIFLREDKFSYHYRGYWNERENRKKFMDSIVAQVGTSQGPIINSIMSKKGGYAILKYYNGNLKRAFGDLYPQN